MLQIHKDGLTLDGKPFYLASGDIHYFRIFPGGWRRRLELAKEFGLTAVQTYVPWNLHEPRKGEFCFEGILDLGAFLSLCNEIGLKVLLRPSVYICSELDFGGLPSWLLKERDICIRSRDEKFMRHVREYLSVLCEIFVPYLSTNGGPIIAVAIENEYGSFGTDTQYLEMIGQILMENGVDVPFYTANGVDAFKLQHGTLPQWWAGIDFKTESKENIYRLRAQQPDKPPFATEFWPGCAIQWGGVFKRQTPQEVLRAYEKALELGCYVNFYMFCGGTNFGFQNGALEGVYRADVPGAKNRYIPFATSYDVDALVTEYGTPTEKYELCKKALAKHLGKEYKKTEFNYRAQKIGNVPLTETADLFENIDVLAEKKVESPNVVCMEDLDQDYGFILYRTNLKYTDSRVRYLRIDGLHDRATVYANGKYIGTYMRDRESEDIKFVIPKEGLCLDILVENMGRINYGYKMLFDRKGITECVRTDIENEDGTFVWNYALLLNWTIYTLPLRNLSDLRYGSDITQNCPGFYRGTFSAEKGVDTFLKLKGWTKGNVWINGFNIGRYWNVGPQETLYVPGELIEKHNVIEVFEIHRSNESKTVEFTDKPMLDSIKQNTELVLSERA